MISRQHFASIAGALIFAVAAAGCLAAGNRASTHRAPSIRVVDTPLAPASTYSELRGLWVVRDSIESPESIRNIVANAKAHHFNTLFVQVRGRGDAFYHSTLEPRAEGLDKQSADFDPLQETLSQAHAAGLQVHAWVNTCLVWGSPKRPVDSGHVVNAHPEWLARDNQGRYGMNKGPDCEGAFLTPANLDARRHIHDVFLEIAQNYDIDGIHFDYVRYPNVRYDFSTASLGRFQSEIDQQISAAQRAGMHKALKKNPHVYVHVFGSQFADFRRRQVTEMVRDISHDVKQIKPWVVVSAAVFADYGDAYALRGQDWKLWLRQGYLDAVCPMAYGASTAHVAAQIADAERCAAECHRMVFAGIGAWHIPAASTIAKIGAARSLGTGGQVLFSYGGMTKDGSTNAYLDKVGSACYGADVPVPAMPWLGTRPATATASSKPSDGHPNG